MLLQKSDNKIHKFLRCTNKKKINFSLLKLWWANGVSKHNQIRWSRKLSNFKPLPLLIDINYNVAVYFLCYLKKKNESQMPANLWWPRDGHKFLLELQVDSSYRFLSKLEPIIFCHFRNHHLQNEPIFIILIIKEA